MAFVADNFQRANGALGGNWGVVNQFHDNGLAIASQGGIQLLNHAFAPISTGGEAALCAYTGTTFGNNQWAQAQISAIAPSTSVVHITACTASGGTSVYTYTLTSGSALQTGEWIYVAGMTNAGNNSPGASGFQITALGGGTFSVLNASPGANESGSNGTGTIASDSVCGVAVRCSADGKNGYVLQIGTNSGAAGGNGVPTDQRLYTRELWKVVNGTASILQFAGVELSVLDVVGDVYALTANGTTLACIKNGTVLFSVTDASLTSGSPGIGTWSVGGSGEWTSPTSFSTGNSGTQWTNFQAGDTNFTSGSGISQVASSNFTGSGDLVTNNPSWSYIGTATATVGSNQLTPTASGGAKHSAVLATAQYSQMTMVTLANGTTQENQGPSVCNQNTNDRYYIQLGTSAAVAAQFRKSVSSVVTTFFSGAAPQFVNGDVAAIAVYNGIVSVFQNGMLVLSIADTALSGGKAGYYADVATPNGVMSTWSAGNVTPPAPGLSVSWIGRERRFANKR